MKDEIKEILENVKKCCEIMETQNFVVYQRQDILKVLDYITNLQEIEKEHKNCTRKHWQQKCVEHCANEMIYKSRNEKAIELINAWLEGLNNDDIIILLNDLGNVLQGEGK